MKANYPKVCPKLYTIKYAFVRNDGLFDLLPLSTLFCFSAISSVFFSSTKTGHKLNYKMMRLRFRVLCRCARCE